RVPVAAGIRGEIDADVGTRIDIVGVCRIYDECVHWNVWNTARRGCPGYGCGVEVSRLPDMVRRPVAVQSDVGSELTIGVDHSARYVLRVPWSGDIREGWRTAGGGKHFGAINSTGVIRSHSHDAHVIILRRNPDCTDRRVGN